MRGRARVLMDLRAEALARIGASDAEPTPDSTAEHLAAQYAVALAAVRQRDWTRADARRWWADFRARQDAPPSAAAPTLTITVDLGDRA